MFPEPVNLAHYLVDHALPGDDPVKGVGLIRRDLLRRRH